MLLEVHPICNQVKAASSRESRTMSCTKPLIMQNKMWGPLEWRAGTSEGRGGLPLATQPSCLGEPQPNLCKQPRLSNQVVLFLVSSSPFIFYSLFVSFNLFFFSASLVLLPHPGLDDPALGTQACQPSAFACSENGCQACTLHSRSLMWAWACSWAKGLGALRINISSLTNFNFCHLLPILGDILKISSHVRDEHSLLLSSFSCAQTIWDLLLSIYASFPQP